LKNDLNLTSAEVDYILSPKAIREQALNIFTRTCEGRTSFTYHPEKLKPTVEYVLQVIAKNYPDLNIPFHSRWGHFRVGGMDRVAQLNESLKSFETLERARIKLDLVITSVLLDAGAGADWKYLEKNSGKSFSRSEGLGVASYYMFLSGAMSSDKKSHRADGEGLKKVSLHDLQEAFQVSGSNPLVGAEGRVQLLNNLGAALQTNPIFENHRPGNILDYLMKKCGSTIPAPMILRAVLDGLGSIWPGRLSAGGENLGDVWRHSKLGAPDSLASLVPLHKLSQWMTYSLIEPIEEAGCKVTQVENLTGLAEYRNGGLMIDAGLLSLKNPEDSSRAWSPDSDLIIEWRALTVYLLDQIGAEIQKALKKPPQDFPLAKVLEGGTWWAGRFLAQEKRAGAVPPLEIKSDGTVF
jgi:hypothetical protein